MSPEGLVVQIDGDAPDRGVVARAARLIRTGAVLVVPTDTCYGFAANALDPLAVQRVFEIKQRPREHPILVAVADLAMADEYVEFNESAQLLASEFLPGPLTLVLPRKWAIPDILVCGGQTVGIRIPDNRVLLEVVSAAAMPVTATSANLSGFPPAYSVAEVLEQLGRQASKLGLVLDQGRLPMVSASTIVDLSAAEPRIVREGPIPRGRVLKALGVEVDDPFGHAPA